MQGEFLKFTQTILNSIINLLKLKSLNRKMHRILEASIRIL